MRREQFTVDKAPLIEVSFRSGEVKVVKGPEGSVEVTIDGPHPDQFVIAQTGSSVIVRQEPGSWQTIGRGAHRLSIVTPEGSGLEASLASADLVAELPLKSLQAETASGDVRLGAISGDGDVKTASGDVRVDAVGGELRSSSASGELRVGSLVSGWLRTASGDVVVEQADGTTEIKTASGNVAGGEVHRRRAFGQDGERRLHRWDPLRHRTGLRSEDDVGTGGPPRPGAGRAAGGALRPAQLQIGVRRPQGTSPSELPPTEPALASLGWIPGIPSRRPPSAPKREAGSRITPAAIRAGDSTFGDRLRVVTR